ncbi:MAG TPA: glycine zipper family protein [Streptosporangiaceae bacterium]
MSRARAQGRGGRRRRTPPESASVGYSRPSVLLLPGTGKNFEQFQADDAVCRQWVLQQTGTTPNEAGALSTVTGAAVGTAVGAGLGAAIGAAAGSPATGAAVGAGAGLFGGTAVSA